LGHEPDITNPVKEFNLRNRESGFYLSVMGNSLTGVAPKQQISFREERLPIAEGWKTSIAKTVITTESLNPIENIISDVSNWTATQAQAREDLVLGPNLTI
ncbi:hypothetical protein C8F04DRAFT_967017, partial [Mycena alexandri]